MFRCNLSQIEKTRLGLAEIGFKEPISVEDGAFLLNEITNYIFDTSKANNSKKVFDYELDYRYYWADFLDKGINLNTQDISWWEFDALLETIFLKKDSAISRVLEYRNYQKPTGNYKTAEQQEQNYYMKMKKQYALPQEQYEGDALIEKMYNFVASKKGADGS